MSNANSHERRQFGRRDSLITASIAVRGRSPQPCTLLNYSATGALIEFREAAPVAQMFHLMIAEKSVDILCQVRHRTPRTLGVSFVGGTIEHFIEAFRPQPLVPADRLVAAAGASKTAAVSNKSLRREMFDRENEVEQPASPENLAAGLALSDQAPAAQEEAPRLEELYAVLEAIPEFTQAGFRMEACETSAELYIFQRAIRRGTWLEGDGTLIWVPTGLGLDRVEVTTVDKAALHTMYTVLSVLQRRRRSAFMGSDANAPENADRLQA